MKIAISWPVKWNFLSFYCKEICLSSYVLTPSESEINRWTDGRADGRTDEHGLTVTMNVICVSSFFFLSDFLTFRLVSNVVFLSHFSASVAVLNCCSPRSCMCCCSPQCRHPFLLNYMYIAVCTTSDKEHKFRMAYVLIVRGFVV
jgi:hypothetical protein